MSRHNGPSPRVVDRFDPEMVAPGAVHRLWLRISEDGLSEPLKLPILVARGRRPGPIVGLTAAVHGNELNGIPVIHRLIAGIDTDALRGMVVAVVVVNVPGLHNHQRHYGDGWDLNHIFPGRNDGNSAEVFVHRLLDRVVRHFDFLIDLHTASFGRVNSLYVRADMSHPVAARMAYLQRPQIVVHSSPSDGTLRGAAADLGIPAITAEIGNPQLYNREFIRRSLAGLRALLAWQKMIRKRPLVPAPDPVLCRRSYWLYTDRGGLLDVLPGLTDTLTANDEIATLTDPFGDTIAAYRAPEDGVVVGRSVDPVAPTGARILHLGIPVAPTDDWFQQPEPSEDDPQ